MTRQIRIYWDDVLAYQIYDCKGCKLENEYNEVICVVSRHKLPVDLRAESARYYFLSAILRYSVKKLIKPIMVVEK